MRTLLLASALLVAGLVQTGNAVAQPYLIPFVGYALEAGYDNGATYVARAADELDTKGGFSAGLGVEVHVPWDRLPFILGVRPSIAVALVPGETVTFEGGESLDFSQRYWQAGLDIIGEIPVGRSAAVPFLGVGLTYAHYSADFDTAGGASVVGSTSVSAWAVAPDLLVGCHFGRGRVTPLVEARYRFATPSPTFSAERPGADIDNGFSVVAGARIAL